MKILFCTNNLKQIQTNYSSNAIPRFYGKLVDQQPDIVALSASASSFNKRVDDFYSRMLKDMNICSPQDIQKIAEEISKDFNISEKETYKLLDVLTVYGSFKSLSKFKSITDIVLLEDNNKENNMDIFANIPVTLNPVMAYIGKRNLNFSYITVDTVNKNNDKSTIAPCIIIDKLLIDYLENLPQKNLEHIKKDYLQSGKIKPIYIDNFEGCYNFLCCGKTLKDVAETVLSEALTLPDSYGELFDKVEYILNGKNIKRLKALGIEVNRIKIPENSQITPQTITNNINPILPTKDYIQDVISGHAHYFQDEESECRKYLIEFLYKTFCPITPQIYAKAMVDLHKKIEQYISVNKKNPNNVFYVIPNPGKSFVFANYVYQQVNDIKNPKNILVYPYVVTDDFMKNFPKNSTLIVLDDCIISGMSLAYSEFPYQQLMNKLDKDSNDLAILRAVITATPDGVQNINDEIIKYRRENVDRLFVWKLLPEWKIHSPQKEYDFLGTEYSGRYITSLVFPYMGPDTNCKPLVPIYEKFLFSPDAQKIIVPKFNPFNSESSGIL